MSTLDIAIGPHFIKRFMERWKVEGDYVEYLNNTLKRGIFKKDLRTGRGVYFPNAGVYIPLSEKNLALTFQFMSMNPLGKEIAVRWSMFYE